MRLGESAAGVLDTENATSRNVVGFNRQTADNRRPPKLRTIIRTSSQTRPRHRDHALRAEALSSVSSWCFAQAGETFSAAMPARRGTERSQADDSQPNNSPTRHARHLQVPELPIAARVTYSQRDPVFGFRYGPFRRSNRNPACWLFEDDTDLQGPYTDTRGDRSSRLIPQGAMVAPTAHEAEKFNAQSISRHPCRHIGCNSLCPQVDR